MSATSSTTGSTGYATVVITVSTTAGNEHTVTASNGSVSGTSATIEVIHTDTLTSITTTTPTGVVAGQEFALMLAGFDQYGNFMSRLGCDEYEDPYGEGQGYGEGEDATYSITVTGASNPSGHGDYDLPTSATFYCGYATIYITLTESTTVTLNIAMNPSCSTNPFYVSPASVNYYVVEEYDTEQTVGEEFSVLVSPYDVYDNATTGGTVILEEYVEAGANGRLQYSDASTVDDVDTSEGA